MIAASNIQRLKEQKAEEGEVKERTKVLVVGRGVGKVKMGELRGKGEVLTSPLNNGAIPGHLLPIVMYIAFDVISDNLVGQCQQVD